jgi:hypothetical protein
MRSSVFKSSSVRFFDPEVGNHGPQPIQTIAQPSRTTTELNRTGPIQFDEAPESLSSSGQKLPICCGCSLGPNRSPVHQTLNALCTAVCSGRGG